MSIKKIHIIILFFSLFKVGDTFGQDRVQDSLLQRFLQIHFFGNVQTDYEVGSGVGYAVFKIEHDTINLLEFNCSNIEINKRIANSKAAKLNFKMKEDPKKIYLLCFSLIAENRETYKISWKNNETYEGLQNFQFGEYWDNVTVLKPISYLYATRIAKKIPKQNTDR